MSSTPSPLLREHNVLAEGVGGFPRCLVSYHGARPPRLDYDAAMPKQGTLPAYTAPCLPGSGRSCITGASLPGLCATDTVRR